MVVAGPPGPRRPGAVGRIAAIAAAAAFLPAGCGGGADSPPDGGDPVERATVRMVNFTYRPAVVAIEPGGSVTWTNADAAPHTATADRRRAFDTGTVRLGASRTIELDRPGTYSYHCTFHRFMVARVVVK